MMYATSQDIDRCKKLLIELIGEENIYDIELAINNVMNISYSKGGGYSEKELTAYIVVMKDTNDPRVFGKK